MTVISTLKDPETLTLTLVAEFDAPPRRVWEVWENPRLLERWWGPPTWPATFTRHDFVEGGGSRYHMSGPDGARSYGYWTMYTIDQPHRLVFANGLADDTGEPDPRYEPMRAVVTLEAIATGTRMTAMTTFVDVAQMEMMLGMGMEEGMSQAIGQLDAVLAGRTS